MVHLPSGVVGSYYAFPIWRVVPVPFHVETQCELIAAVTLVCFRNLAHKGYIGYMVPRIRKR